MGITSSPSYTCLWKCNEDGQQTSFTLVEANVFHILSLWLADPNKSHNHFSHDIWTSNEYQSEVCHVKWSYSPFNYSRVLNLEWLSYFEHVLQPLFNTCIFSVHSWSHT